MLVGLMRLFDGGVVVFECDFVINFVCGDENYLVLFDVVDVYVVCNGLDLLEELDVWCILLNFECVVYLIFVFDFVGVGIVLIVWVMGYVVDYGWLNVDVFGLDGKL